MTLIFCLNCIDNDMKAPCGRPLGLAFDTISDKLIVMHSSDGIFEVDLKSGSKKQLLSADTVIGDEVRVDAQVFFFFELII